MRSKRENGHHKLWITACTIANVCQCMPMLFLTHTESLISSDRHSQSSQEPPGQLSLIMELPLRALYALLSHEHMSNSLIENAIESIDCLMHDNAASDNEHRSNELFVVFHRPGFCRLARPGIRQTIFASEIEMLAGCSVASANCNRLQLQLLTCTLVSLHSIELIH